jgi:hypothetical protein
MVEWDDATLLGDFLPDECISKCGIVVFGFNMFKWGW